LEAQPEMSRGQADAQTPPISHPTRTRAATLNLAMTMMALLLGILRTIRIIGSLGEQSLLREGIMWDFN
jgi:hypothetical protein